MAHITLAPEAVTVQSPATRHPGFGGRIPELDGVRAVAIWMVMIAHVLFAFPNPDHAFDQMPRVIRLLLDHGWLGVDLFFALSGFLITGILLDTKEKPHYARNFYGRRLLRIFPLYILSSLVMWLFYSNSTRYLLISLVFLANFSQPLHVHEPHGMGILWSLNVEEHFYLLWPWLVLLLNRRQLAYTASALVLLSPVLRWYCSAHGIEIYYYSWFRLDGLATGALLAMWVRSGHHNKKNSLRLAAILTGVFLVITAAGLPFGIMQESVAGHALRFTQANAVFGGLLVSVLALLNTPFTAIFRIRFATLAGELSYCLYLIHLAVGDAYVELTNRFSIHPEQLFGPFGAVLVRFVAVIGASYLIALFSWKYFEQPFLRLKKHF